MKNREKLTRACVGIAIATVFTFAACEVPENDSELAALQDEVKNLRRDLLQLQESSAKSSPRISSAEPIKTVSSESGSPNSFTAQKEYEIKLIDIPLDATGSEACQSIGMSCISVTSSRTVDSKDRFCGYSNPTCTSRVRHYRHCIKNADGSYANYALDRTAWRRASDATRGAECTGGNRILCLPEPEYESAICIGGLVDPPPTVELQ